METARTRRSKFSSHSRPGLLRSSSLHRDTRSPQVLSTFTSTHNTTNTTLRQAYFSSRDLAPLSLPKSPPPIIPPASPPSSRKPSVPTSPPDVAQLMTTAERRTKELEEKLSSVTSQLDSLAASRREVAQRVRDEFCLLEQEVVLLRREAERQLELAHDRAAENFKKQRWSLEQSLGRLSNEAKRGPEVGEAQNSISHSDKSSSRLVGKFSCLHKIIKLLKKSSVEFHQHEATSLEHSDTGKVHLCRPGERSLLLVHSLDVTGACVPYGGATVEARVKDKLSGSEHPAAVEDRGDGSYNIGFTLPSPGVFTLCVHLWGTPIKSATLLVQCSSSCMTPVSPSRIPRLINRSSSNLSKPVLRLASESDDSGLPSPESNWRRSIPEDLWLTSLKESSTTTLIPEDDCQDIEASSFVARWVADYSHHQSSGVLELPRSHRAPSDVPDDNPIAVGRDGLGDLVRVFGQLGSGRGQFRNPQALCYSSGLLYVSDSTAARVQGLDAVTGACRVQLTRADSIQRPVGLATTASGTLLVADYDARCILEFSEEGKVLRSLGGGGKLLGPKGVAVDSRGRIIVADNKANCVYILSPAGKVIKTIGGRNSRESRLAGPRYVTVRDNDDIVVSDFHNHRVMIYDCQGNEHMTVGNRGEGMGQFNGPTGVTCDDSGRILVADWGNSRLQLLDQDGSFHSYVDTTDAALYGPQGTCMSPDGLLAVADAGNHCVKLFRYGEDAGITDIDGDFSGSLFFGRTKHF